MKIFDLHIGLSDAILQLKKDPTIEDKATGSFPNQFDFIRAKKGGLDTFCGMICPIQINGHEISLPVDQKAEVSKHLEVYKSLENLGHLKIVRETACLAGSQGGRRQEPEGLDSMPEVDKQARPDTAKDSSHTTDHESSEADSGQLKAIIGLEGVYFVNDDSDLEFIDELISREIRIIGLKWNLESNLFTGNKLTQLGKEFLKLCEEKKIIIDLAHSESDLIEEILSNFNGLVMNSHTCMFSVQQTPRNIKDEFVKEIVKRKGLVGINFVGEFVGGNTISHLMKHFEYFMNNFGIDNLAIGSDYDGMEDTDLIRDLEDVSKYRNLVNAFQELGLNKEEIEKILFNNAYEYFMVIGDE